MVGPRWFDVSRSSVDTYSGTWTGSFLDGQRYDRLSKANPELLKIVYGFAMSSMLALENRTRPRVERVPARRCVSRHRPTVGGQALALAAVASVNPFHGTFALRLNNPPTVVDSFVLSFDIGFHQGTPKTPKHPQTPAYPQTLNHVLTLPQD